ncbi:hypothetical protein VCHA53O466_50370 [Vibrio chagasii]|nr:hypothetical protein VCHA53O466_50370 [Vibrio chagasii]
MHPEIHTLTLKEYFKLTNPKNEYHDSGSYETKPIGGYQDFMKRGFGYDKVTHEKVKTVKRHGLLFTVYKDVQDMMDHPLHKRTDDGSEWEKDENGKLIEYNQGDKLRILTERDSRYRYEHHIVNDETGEIVANTQDEWGCLLYNTATEYAGFGLGGLLLEADHEVHPFRHSGGYTPEGYAGAARFHEAEVRKALASGKYSKMVFCGEKTVSDVQDILRSANVINWLKEMPEDKYSKYKEIYDERGKSVGLSRNQDDGRYSKGKMISCRLPDAKARFDLSMNKASDLVLAVEENSAILYNKKIYDVIHNEDSLPSESAQYWHEKAIKGYVYVGGVYDPTATPRIHGVYAERPEVEKLMFSVALNLWSGDKLRVTPEQRALIRALPDMEITEEQDLDYKYVTLDKATMNLASFCREELRVQKVMGDKWGEKRGIIGELAYGLAEEFENEARFFNSKPDDLKDLVVESEFEKKLKASISTQQVDGQSHEAPKIKSKSVSMRA